MSKVMNCHMAQIKAEEFVKKAQEMSEAIHFRRGDFALEKLDELVRMATELNRSVNLWKLKFDDEWHKNV